MNDRITAKFGTRLTHLGGAMLVGFSLVLAPVAAMAQDAAAPAAAPAQAAPAPISADTVVATVGDEKITEADLAAGAQDVGQQLQQVAPADQRAYVLTMLINIKVMSKAALGAKLDQSADFKRNLAYARERALGQAYFDTSMAAPVTPDQLKKAYADLVAAFKPVDEVHAKHILVASQDDAKAIKAQIDGGASFEDLAKSKSTDTGSAANGGDLGFFSHDQMVKPFADAAFALDAGKVSDPVQSQFGWHIIKVEEKRKSAPPSLADATPQLEQQIRLKTFTDAITALKKGLAINIPDPALAAAVTAKANATPGN